MFDPLATSTVVLSILFSILAIVVVGLRFYCRSLKKTAYGIDDWLILPALLFAIGVAITNCIGVFNGRLGEHMLIGPDGMPVLDEAITIFGKTSFVVQVISVPCFAFAKLSVLCFYRRIFRGATFDLITWILIGLTAAWGISFGIATLAQCNPIDVNWETSNFASGRPCIDVMPFYLATAASDFILDIAILCVPWPNVWQLQMPKRQKFAVVGIFMLGGFVCGIGITRFVFFIQSEHASPAVAGDRTYNSAPTLYWTQLEGAFAVICACLPTLRPLFHGISPESIFGSRGGRIFSAPSSKASSKERAVSGEDSSSIALHSINSSSGDAEETSQYDPNRVIRVQRDFDQSYSTRS